MGKDHTGTMPTQVYMGVNRNDIGIGNEHTNAGGFVDGLFVDVHAGAEYYIKEGDAYGARAGGGGIHQGYHCLDTSHL